MREKMGKPAGSKNKAKKPDDEEKYEYLNQATI